MASSIDYTDVAAYRAYVEAHKHDIITQGYFGFETLPLLTTHEGVKGKLVLDEMILGDLIKYYVGPGHTFAASDNKIVFQPRELTVYNATVELRVRPKDLESTYMGELRKKGQNPLDWPMQAFIMGRLTAKQSREIEIAIWKAVRDTPIAGSPLLDIFDGYLKQIADAITAGDIVPEVTGPIDNTNAVEAVETVFAGLTTDYISGRDVDICMSPEMRILYFQDYRERYGKFTGEKMPDGSHQMDISRAFIHGLPGMSGSQRIVIVPRGFLNYGYDSAEDMVNYNFEQEDRNLKIWTDFNIGGAISLLEEGLIAVNDQA